MKTPYLILIATLLATPTAFASGGHESVAATNPKWKAECGACHVAYPPRLLPEASWKALMGSLDKHFGSDAGVDAVAANEILQFLVKNASHRQPEANTKPVLRITETHWFQGEHEEVPARVWKDPRVKSPANCAACHTKAETGDFNERNIRLPR